jgi:hypothetical protein
MTERLGTFLRHLYAKDPACPLATAVDLARSEGYNKPTKYLKRRAIQARSIERKRAAAPLTPPPEYIPGPLDALIDATDLICKVGGVDNVRAVLLWAEAVGMPHALRVIDALSRLP